VRAAWPSGAAASRFLLSENWRVIWLRPSVFWEVIESRPSIVENCFSRGVATAAAMVSGLAPGRAAVTRIVGKSTLGRSLTGRRRKDMTPKTRSAVMMRVVMTGRRTKGAEMFMASGRTGSR
jgi:hypothetical protein